MPISYFLIQHRNGPVLFDTGLDSAIVTDKRYISSPVGRFLLRRIFRLHLSEEHSLDRILAANGQTAKDICTAVFSHLHFDHVGSIAHTFLLGAILAKETGTDVLTFAREALFELLAIEEVKCKWTADGLPIA